MEFGEFLDWMMAGGKRRLTIERVSSIGKEFDVEIKLEVIIDGKPVYTIVNLVESRELVGSPFNVVPYKIASMASKFPA